MLKNAMIYQNQKVAVMIAGKMTKSKGVKYIVRQIELGYQVAPEVTPVELATPPKTTPTLSAMKTKDGNIVVVQLKFRGESKVYVDAFLDGKPVSFGKTTLVDWTIEGDMVTLRLPKSVAKRRGLLAA